MFPILICRTSTDTRVSLWEEVVVTIFFISENSSTVRLHKGSSGLGFSVAGGTDADTDLLKQIVRIKQIFPASPASHSGQLRVGDVILRINEQRIDGLKRSVSTSWSFSAL